MFNLPTQEFELEDWQYLLSVNPDSPSGALVADAATSVANGWEDLNGNIRNRSEINLTEMMDFVQNSSISNNNYQPQTIRAVLQRMTTWDNHDLIGGNSFEIRSLLTPGNVSIFMLNRLPESVRYVVVSVLTKVLRIRSHDSFIKTELIDSTWSWPWDGLSMLDHVMRPSCSHQGKGNPAKPNLIRLVKEGRNSAHRSFLPLSNLAPMKKFYLNQTFSCHQLSIKEAWWYDQIQKRSATGEYQAVKPRLNIFTYWEHLALANWVSSLPVHQNDREMITQIDPRVRVHGGFEAWGNRFGLNRPVLLLVHLLHRPQPKTPRVALIFEICRAKGIQLVWASNNLSHIWKNWFTTFELTRPKSQIFKSGSDLRNTLSIMR